MPRRPPPGPSRLQPPRPQQLVRGGGAECFLAAHRHADGSDPVGVDVADGWRGRRSPRRCRRHRASRSPSPDLRCRRDLGRPPSARRTRRGRARLPGRGRRSGSSRRREAARRQPGWPTGRTTRRATPRRRSAASRPRTPGPRLAGVAPISGRGTFVAATAGLTTNMTNAVTTATAAPVAIRRGSRRPRVATTVPPAARPTPAAARTSVAARTSSGPPLARCGANPTATAIAGTPTMTATRPRQRGGSRSSAMTAAAVNEATVSTRSSCHPGAPSRAVSTASAAPHSTVPRGRSTARRTRPSRVPDPPRSGPTCHRGFSGGDCHHGLTSTPGPAPSSLTRFGSSNPPHHLAGHDEVGRHHRRHVERGDGPRGESAATAEDEPGPVVVGGVRGRTPT